MKRIALLLAASLTVAGAVGITLAPAAAELGPCENGQFNIKALVIMTGLGRSTGDSLALGDGNEPTLYVDDRDSLTGRGTWVYMESNGVPHLQRGGTTPTGETDACNDGWTGEPDTLLF